MNGNKAWPAISIIVSLILVLVASVSISTYNQNRDNKKWCALLNTITAPPPGKPNEPQPTTPYGKQLQAYNKRIAEQLDQLATEYGCK